MRALLQLTVALAACTSSPTPMTITCGSGTMLDGSDCVAMTTSCGTGTHDQSGTCVPDGSLPAYQVRAYDQIVADNLTTTTVAAFGVNADGSFATDPIVFDTDRPGAGSFTPAAATLGALGATTTFLPCDSATPGCVGAVGFTIALASAPTTAIAHVASELIAPPLVGTSEQCLGSANVLYLEGSGFIYTGKLTISDASFAMTGGDARAMIQIVPTAPIQGAPFGVELDSVQLGTALVAGAYQGGMQVATLGHPGIDITNPSVFAHCDFSTAGEFQIYDYAIGSHITVSFRTWCTQNPEEVVSGCLHVE